MTENRISASTLVELEKKRAQAQQDRLQQRLQQHKDDLDLPLSWGDNRPKTCAELTFQCQHPNSEKDSRPETANQSDRPAAHEEWLYQSYLWHGGVRGRPFSLQVRDFVSPDGSPCLSDRSKWLPGVTIDPQPDYKRYAACCVEQAMLRDTCSYWIGACPDIAKNLYYLKLALLSSVQLFRHRLTHGLIPACSRLRVIDKSWLLSRLVKGLLRVPANPYSWVDELCQARQDLAGSDSLSEPAD